MKIQVVVDVKTTLGEGQLPGSIRHAARIDDHVEYEVEAEAGTLFVVDPAVDRNPATAAMSASVFTIAGSPSSTVETCIY